MTFEEKCHSQGYHGKKWGKMFLGEKCRREKCHGEKRPWGKLSCTQEFVLHMSITDIFSVTLQKKLSQNHILENIYLKSSFLRENQNLKLFARGSESVKRYLIIFTLGRHK